MPIPINKDLYNLVKREADIKYSKPSAYKSGYIVKEYKKRGGKYKDDKEPRNLKRWFKEKWGDIGGLDYPVYRPFKRVSSKTPLTAYEIDPYNAIQQIILKQKIRGNKNLPKFVGGADEDTPPQRRIRERESATPPKRTRQRIVEPDVRIQIPSIFFPSTFSGEIPSFEMIDEEEDLPTLPSFRLPDALQNRLNSITETLPVIPSPIPPLPIPFVNFTPVLPNQNVFDDPQLLHDLQGLDTPTSVAELYFTGDGRKPDEFKKSIQNVFNILGIRGNYDIIGSASDPDIMYYSDFDLSTFEKVSLENIKRIFQNKYKIAEKDPNLFITDFKCGEINGEPVRWDKTTIQKEKQKIGNSTITLDECLLMPSTIKMDIVALIDGDFIEFSDNYYLSVNGVKNYTDDAITKNVLLKQLAESAKEYYNQPNYMKYLKRIFSIKSIKGASTKKLVDFFNSQVGLLNKSKTDLETLILVLENKFRKPKLNDICNNIQIIKQNIGTISEIELKSTLYKDLDKICSYKNQTSIIKNLKKVIQYIQRKVNETTKNFISKNKI